LVIFGTTDEQWGGNDFTDLNAYFAHTGPTPGGNGVPSNTLPTTPATANQYFGVAIIDTGAQASILSFDTANQIDLDAAGRLGNHPQQIIGASGSETTDITDP